ncbi:MAG: type-F conjugative transfer system secretin TraK [Geobacteraceae bacterium]
MRRIMSIIAFLAVAAGAKVGLADGVPAVPPSPTKSSTAMQVAASTGPERNGPFPAELQTRTVIPEVSTAVTLSNSDINRITCREEIKDVVFSREKGLSVKTIGKDAFVKFLITRKDEKEVYSSTPSELFVVCGENVYNLIALPKRVPSQTVRLSPGAEKIRENRRLYGELPFEKKILAIIRSVYTSEIPEGFSTVPAGDKLSLFKDLEVTLVRIHRVEGEGLLVKEYLLAAKKQGEELKLTEKDFLRPAIAARPVAISLDRHAVPQGNTARLIVVEQSHGATEGGGDGAQRQD